MARIRTIKPEFTQSESIGRLSRDARLLFVQIWTIVDDEGRARASSRGLASGLYPFDDDAREKMDGWLAELARERLITRYEVDGSTYMVVNNWLKHQKIDRPTPSRLPGFNEASRVIDEHSAKPRAPLAADLVPSTLDHGPRTMDHGEEAREKTRATLSDPVPETQPASKAKKTKPEVSRGTRWHPDNQIPDEWLAAAADARGRAGLPPVDMRHEVVKFSHYWASPDAKNPMKKDWQQTFINWILNSKGSANGQGKSGGQRGATSAAGEVFGRLYATARAQREAAGE